MDRKLKMSIGIGGPSIIMIFVVLCLTTLAALSLMTANADWKLTKKAAKATTDYYKADSKAEEILAGADADLKTGKPLESETYTVPVSETQNLIMKLHQNGSHYVILSRKLEPKSQWNYDDYKTQYDDRIVE
jgi:hypothetical protein